MKEINTMNLGAQQKSAKRKVITSVALAVALATSGLSFSAQALVLGQIRINSSLGEPLKAEVPITQLTADEASSLQVMMATPSDFGSRGLTYGSVLSSIRVSYELTGKDTAVIKITSQRPIQDPFIDLLMDVRWRAGNVQRSYTMLIDPPKSIRDAAVATSPSSSTQVSVLQPSTRVAGEDGVIHERIVASSEQISPPATTQPTSPQASTTPSSAVQRPAQPAQTRPVSSTGSDLSMTVSRGQTLGQIANSMKPDGVSTEQMLAALYKANPKAFINNNINWVRAGATLRIPSESEIAAVSKSEARGIVSAHAREFNEYRARVAGGTHTVKPEEGGGRTAVGGVKPAQEPSAPSSPTTELVITSGEKEAAEAAAQQAREDAARQAEVDKNAQELAELNNALGGTSSTGEAVSGTQIPPATANEGQGTSTPGPLAAGTGDTPVSEGTISTNEQPETPAVVNETPPVVNTPAPAMPLEKSIIDQLLENPLIPLAGVGVVIALIGGVIMIRRRKAAKYDDFDDPSDMLDEGGDSFFADNHSQQNDSHMLDQSSSIYAASQLDTNADVDPVQEADVYLAYGRDEQAAEILRDALQLEPNRVALHAKLCEVYARQNNVRAFDEQAAQLRALTSGQGTDWSRIARLAQSISPDNPIFSETVETQNLKGFATQFSSSQSPLQEVQDTRSLKYPEDDMNVAPQGVQSNDDYDNMDITLDLANADEKRMDDFSNTGGADSASFMLDEDDEEGPSTRLALAEEFFAIGNKKDAKDIAEEVLSQSASDEVRRRASSLLNKVS